MMVLEEDIKRINSERKELEKALASLWPFLSHFNEDIRSKAQRIIDLVNPDILSADIVSLHETFALAYAIIGQIKYDEASCSGKKNCVKKMREAIPLLEESFSRIKKLNGSAYAQSFLFGFATEGVETDLVDAYRIVGNQVAQINTLREIGNRGSEYAITKLTSLYRNELTEEEGEIPFEKLSELFQWQVNSAEQYINLVRASKQHVYDEEIDTQAAFRHFAQSAFNIIDLCICQGYIDEGLEKAYYFRRNCLPDFLVSEKITNKFDNQIKKWEKIREERNGLCVPSDEELKRVLKPETIEALSKETDIKLFVGTSLMVFDSLNNFKSYSLDYSPVILPLYKAIERILYKLLIKKYLADLKKKGPGCADDCAKKYSKEIYNRQTNSFVTPKFSIGKGLHIMMRFEEEQSAGIYEDLEMYFANNGVKNSGRWLQKLYNMLQDPQCLTTRNNCAHRFYVGRIYGEEAWDYITNTAHIIDFCYEHFGPLLKED